MGEQDKPSYPPAKGTTLVDNEKVCVTEWAFQPGEATGWHRHGYNYVVVPMTDGLLKLDTPTGPATATLTIGGAYYRDAGVEHNVINGGTAPLTFIEIEIKPAK